MANGIQTSLFTLLDSDSPEWSESIILLGKGIYTWSRKYKTRICCVAGIGEVSGFMRLYPIFAHEKVSKFDVVQAAIRNERPEKHCPESRKIWPNSLKVAACEDEKEEQQRILESLRESGDFLHGDKWREQTLGVISPLEPRFWITRTGKIFVHYRCATSGCNGHLNEVRELIKVDKVGRRRNPSKEDSKKFLRSLKGKQLYFFMGTHRNHPHRWILIATHALPRPRKKQ